MEKPPKNAIFRLWGPAPSPLLGANPRTPRRFHLRTTLKVRAKFGEDRPVNNGAHMGETSSWTAHRIAPKVRWPILVPASLAYRATARPERTRVERSWQGTAVRTHKTFSLSRSSITRRGYTHVCPRRHLHTRSVYSTNSAGRRRQLMHAHDTVARHIHP